MAADDAPRGLKRLGVNLVIVGLIAILCTNALPVIHGAQARLQARLDPIVDVLGLWQGDWALFAPEADKVNSYVVAHVQERGRIVYRWRTPAWRDLSAWKKFRQFRMMEYADGIRQDANRGAWRALARYVARSAASEGATHGAATVALWRHWVIIPLPETPLRPMSEPFEPDQRFMFHRSRHYR